VEAMKTIYGPDLIPTSSFDVEMAGNSPEAEDIAFTLVINKKCKEKGKVFSFSSMSSFDSKSRTSLILWALPLPKAMTTYPASKLVITHPSVITVLDNET